MGLAAWWSPAPWRRRALIVALLAAMLAAYRVKRRGAQESLDEGPSPAPSRRGAKAPGPSAKASALPPGVPPPPRRPPPGAPGAAENGGGGGGGGGGRAGAKTGASPRHGKSPSGGRGGGGARSRRPSTSKSAEFGPVVSAGEKAEIWICLDFEWTCDEGQPRQVHADEGEIIEFSYVVWDMKHNQAVCEGQHYVKPLHTPITEFCIELTGITEEKLENAKTLKGAIDVLQAQLAKAGALKRPCAAVAHGSADLELILPRNCKDLGLEVPTVLRKYVDIREATQCYLASTDKHNVRASSLRQICDALKVRMLGQEHCGLDDAWMVLFASKQLHKVGAALRAIDIDAERKAFIEAEGDTQLVLDGLPYHAVGAEIMEWLTGLLGEKLPKRAIWMISGIDGRPSGRAIVNLGNHDLAVRALLDLEGGRCITCGSRESWPFEAPRERLILIRPLRHAELELPRRKAEEAVGPGPALLPYPWDARALEPVRIGVKGNSCVPEAAANCTGSIKMFRSEKGFGFISVESGVEGGGDVFFHVRECQDFQPAEGLVVGFDIAKDPRTNKTRAVQMRLLCDPGEPRDRFLRDS